MATVLLSLPSVATATCVPIPKPTADAVISPSAFWSNGTISGTPAVAIVNYSGGTGAAFDVIVYYYGTAAVESTTIPATTGGDKIEAFFDRDRLLTYNAVYGPGDAGCCASREAVQRFALVKHGFETKLHRELLTYVRNPRPTDAEQCSDGLTSSRKLENERRFANAVRAAARRPSNVP